MPSESVPELIAAVRRAADAADFPIDEPVYRRAGRDPREPILFAGTLDAKVCVMGRDLGKDEVAAGQPLIGAAGRLVRQGVLKAWGDPEAVQAQPAEGPPLQGALKYVVLTNTVPYKPPGNKAYPESVRRLFRPFLEKLLFDHWQGHRLITLGTEAFRWFEPYVDPAVFVARGMSDKRFESAFHCHLAHNQSPKVPAREITVFPLPHPSPLNRRWYDRFPDMLAERLAEVRKES
jgi:uracil-DNA glycosylase